MCGRLPFSTEYNSEVPGPQGAGAAPTLQCTRTISYLKSLISAHDGTIVVDEQ